jgi:hypothetical protein
LLATHAERLTELSRLNHGKVVVAVTDPTNTVLSLAARLEMVAALDIVDFVLPHGAAIESAIPWAAVHDDTALHNVWSDSFKEHVRRRSQPA